MELQLTLMPKMHWIQPIPLILGVNIDDLLLSQPDTGEQGLEIADALVASGAVDMIVVDSVAALVLVPKLTVRWGTLALGYKRG